MMVVVVVVMKVVVVVAVVTVMVVVMVVMSHHKFIPARGSDGTQHRQHSFFSANVQLKRHDWRAAALKETQQNIIMVAMVREMKAMRGERPACTVTPGAHASKPSHAGGWKAFDL
jgi:hypothetical protein